MNATAAGMISALSWPAEQRRWTAFYQDRLAAQLRAAAGLAESAPPQKVRPHFDSLISLLNTTAQGRELSLLWLELVERLHPLPLRWGQWPAWLEILRLAARKAHEAQRPSQQAEHLAYTANLLLNVGQTGQALETARAAMRLARQSNAAWPLSVAGSTAVATLRSLARFDEAQALIYEVRALLAGIPPPSPPARAAMAETLLDLEQMDLLRYFKRLDDALALGERIIARLSAVEALDPHDLAATYLRQGTITWVSGRYEQAVNNLQQAAVFFRQAGDELQATFAEANLGVVYYSMSRYREAEKLKLAAIRAAEEINARQTLVSELGDMSVIYIGLGHMELAYDYADRTVRLAEELGNTAELSRGRGNRGYTLLQLGRYDEALADIEFSLSRYREQGRLEGTIVTTIDLILYLWRTGEEERAADLARENYERAWREDFPHLHIVTARCLALFPPVAEQKALLGQALALARTYKRPMDEAGCLFSLAALTPAGKAREALYEQGVALVTQMGCVAWLAGKSIADPPLLPITI